MLMAQCAPQCAPVPPPPAAVPISPTTGAWIVGEPGDWIVNGGGDQRPDEKRLDYDALEPVVLLPNAIGVYLGARRNPDALRFEIGAPRGEDLQVGRRYDVPNSPEYTEPYLRLFGMGRGCDEVGFFVVDQIEWDANRNVTAFAAHFEMACYDAIYGEAAAPDGYVPHVRGSVSMNATVPLYDRSLTPTVLSIGTPWDTTSEPRPVTIVNRGTAPLHPGTTLIRGQDASAFSVSADHCAGTVLAPRASCTVEVTFAPRGDRNDRTAVLSYFDELSPTGYGTNVYVQGAALPPG